MRIRSNKNTKSRLALLLYFGGLPLGQPSRIFRALQQQPNNNSSSCSFEDLFASTCSLQDYCATLMPMMASCSGDISNEWFILIQMEEICYLTEQRESSFARHSSTEELPERGFCSLESAYFNFRGSVLENAQHQEIVTYPVKGLLQQVTYYQPCDDTAADSFFGRGYCADPCPQTVLQGSLVCQQPCQTCPDEPTQEVLDCSNIHPTLVETCNQPDSFTEALLQYLKNETNNDSLWSDTSSQVELEGDETTKSRTSPAEQSHGSWAFPLFVFLLLINDICIFQSATI